jgi:hypothetical protein
LHKLHQSPHLLIGDHPTSFSTEGRTAYPLALKTGVLVVVGREF